MIALLFPGQGAQTPGMLYALTQAIPSGRDAIARASAQLGHDLLADDTAAGYAATVAVQVALFVAGVACAQALRTAGVMPDAVAGHSAGAAAAAVAAGALDESRALAFVALRGKLMATAFPCGHGMGAIGGLDESRVAQLAQAVTQPGAPVFAANVNAADQIAISGSLDGVDALLEAARRAGARTARRLAVDTPSHAPLMASVAAHLDTALATSDIRAARIPYATNTGGRLVRDAATIRADLTGNVARPVRWADATRALYESGVRTFIEVRPGTTLTDLAAQAFPDARCVALESTSLDSIVALTARVREA